MSRRHRSLDWDSGRARRRRDQAKLLAEGRREKRRKARTGRILCHQPSCGDRGGAVLALRVRLPDGRTAYRVVRPVFEAALEDLQRGRTPDGQRLDGLIVYDIDRLTRDNRHLEDAIEVVQHFNQPILDITGTLDLLTDNGRTVARIVVATNNKQSADTARRVKRKHLAMRQAGIPTGGRRPFGWQADKRTIEPREAEMIREAARRIVRGAPLSAIVTLWNDSGVLTPMGNRWVKETVKGLFRNPRLCGLRARAVWISDPGTGQQTRQLEIVRTESGAPVVGQWEAILSLAEWEAVTAIIGDNHQPGRGSNSRKYLLTGILRCGKPECGAALRALKAMPSRVKTPGAFYYVCASRGSGGCGGTSIPGVKTDEFVSEAVIAKFELEAQGRDADLAPRAWPQEQELAQIRPWQVFLLTNATDGRSMKTERGSNGDRRLPVRPLDELD